MTGQAVTVGCRVPLDGAPVVCEPEWQCAGILVQSAAPPRPAMRDVTNWSVSCCRDAEIDVRLHASLFLSMAAVLYFRAQAGTPAAVTAVAVIVYLLSLAAREAARAVVSWKWGGRVECIVLGPLGAVNAGEPHEDPRGDLAVALAGPAANLGLAAAAAVMLTALGQPVAADFFPFEPPAGAAELSAIGSLHWVGWINFVLALVNLVPTFPLDGARGVVAALRLRHDDGSTLVNAARIAIAGSLVVLITSMFVGRAYNAAFLVLSILGMVGFFCSRIELMRGLGATDGEDDPFEEPASYEADERRPSAERIGPLRRWWRNRQDAKLRLRLQTEREEEARADEVLARLHLQGMHTLSPQDRALLQRVSARYRQRQ